MDMTFRRCAALLSFVVFVACSSPHSSENAPATQHYTLHGSVVDVDSHDHTAKIAGEKIPGWMGAMTMDYPVQNIADWKLLKPGEKITATVSVAGYDYYLENIKVNNTAAQSAH